MRSTAGLLLACALCFWLSGLKGMSATPPHGHRVALTAARYSHNSEGGSASLRKIARARGRAPGAEQKQVAESGAALHGFIYIRTPPPSSLVLPPL
jgi:hypothetical protein